MVGRTGVVKTSSHAQSTQNSEEEGPVLFGRTDPDHAGLLQRDPRQKIYVIIQDNLDLESDCNEGRRTAESEMVRGAAKEDQDHQHR
jgi:hypothetical protein